MPIHPRPRAPTSGPFVPSRRVNMSLSLENPREFIEERFGRALERIFHTTPEQTPVGVAQRAFDAILNGRLFAFAREIIAVRAIDPIIEDAPHDAILGHDFLKH